MSNIVSSNRATFGVHAEDKPVAKAKAGKHASKLMAFKNREKLKGLQSSGSSSVVVKAIGSKAGIKGGAAPSQADAKKWDEQQELREYNKLETDALKHLVLGSGTSPKERDAWSKMMKSEKDVQRGCNDILLKLARRTSSSAFKAFVSDDLNTKFLSLRMKLQTRVALAKYIGQSHITDVSKYQEAMDKASDEFWWEVPFHMHAHLLKMHLADGVRLGEFEKVVQMIKPHSKHYKNVIESGMTEEDVSDIIGSQVDMLSTKLLRGVTDDITSSEANAPLNRFTSFITKLKPLEDFQATSKLMEMILDPRNADVEQLGLLLEGIARKDRSLPPLVLALTNSSKGSRKLLDNAIDIYEERELEVDEGKQMKEVETTAASMDGVEDAEAAILIFEQFRAQQAAILTDAPTGGDGGVKGLQSQLRKLEVSMMTAFIKVIVQPASMDLVGALTTFETSGQVGEAFNDAATKVVSGLELVLPHVAQAQAKEIKVVVQAVQAIVKLMDRAACEGGFE